MFRIKKAAHVVTAFTCRMRYNSQGLAKESAHSVNVVWGGGSCGAGVVPSVGETFILPVVMKFPVESYVTPGTVMKSKLWGTIQMKLPILIMNYKCAICLFELLKSVRGTHPMPILKYQLIFEATNVSFKLFPCRGIPNGGSWDFQ